MNIPLKDHRWFLHQQQQATPSHRRAAKIVSHIFENISLGQSAEFYGNYFGSENTNQLYLKASARLLLAAAVLEWLISSDKKIERESV